MNKGILRYVSALHPLTLRYLIFYCTEVTVIRIFHDSLQILGFANGIIQFTRLA